MYLLEDGKVYLIEERMLKAQGRGNGLVICRLKSLEDGRIVNRSYKAGTKVEIVNPEVKEMQFLYSDNDGSYFMDGTTYETISIPKKVIGNYINFLKEGEQILVMVYDGKILTVKENPSVVLEVTEAGEAVKGNTANAATKTVTVETGYKLNVPLFIKQGDKIKINTESGEYTGKAN